MFLFRGTSDGWPGNPATQRFQVTPTTTNPFIATLFAVECQRLSSGVVLACLKSDVEHLIGASNVLSEVEQEVVVDVAPAEFSRRFAHWKCEVTKARAVLLELGYEVPEYIGDKNTLNTWVNDAPRLDDEVAIEFHRKIFGAFPS